MKTPLLATLLLALALTSAGCRARGYYGYASQPVAGNQGWVRLSPPGSGLTCTMPGQPRMERRQDQDDDGTAVTVTAMQTRFPRGLFQVHVLHYEHGITGDPLEIVREIALGVLDLPDLHLEHSVRLDLPGYYAREDVVTHPQGAYIGMRQLFGRQRIYVAVVAVPRDQMAMRDAQQFLSSVQVDGNDALYPVAGAGVDNAFHPIYMPQDDFAVHMPPIARVQSEEVIIDSVHAQHQLFEAERGGVTYRVRIVGFRDENIPENALEQVATRFGLGSATGPAQASGFPGVQTELSGNQGEAITSRLFRTATRIYVLETRFAGGNPPADVEDFFSSLRIL